MRERFASEQLNLRGYETFLPLVATKRAGEGRPLFASYLFCRIVEQWRAINICFGVINLVRVGDCPSKMPDAEIENLKAIVAEAEQRGLRFAGLYGTSEVQALFARQRLDVPAHVRGQPGGFPVGDRYGVRVRDPESGHLLVHGESGELELAGPSCMVGYYGDAEATEKAMTADGWVRGGDLGHLLGDGSFVFETRMGDVLRLGGYLVAPSEIEAHIQCYPGIDGCQAVGAVGEDGPVVVAFVTLRPGAAFDEAGVAPALRQRPRGIQNSSALRRSRGLSDYARGQRRKGSARQAARNGAAPSDGVRLQRTRELGQIPPKLVRISGIEDRPSQFRTV